MSNLVFVDTTVLGNHALAYAREKGHTTTLLWSPSHDFYGTPADRAQGRALADRTVEVADLHDPAAALAGLREAGAGKVDAVLTTLHPMVVPAALLARAIGARGTSLEAIEAARDKAACRRIVDAHGIPNVGFAVVTEAAEALEAAERIGYPVVVKPVHGFGKTATSITGSPREVEAYFKEVAARRSALPAGIAVELNDRFIVEEVAVGPLFSIEVATDGRSFTPLAAVRRKLARDNPVLELGSTMPSGLPPADERELGAYAVRVCRALGLDLGIFHVEVIRTADGFRLVEVNPRIAGGTVPEVIRAATGRNLFEALVDLFTGEAVPDRPFPTPRAASHSFLAVEQERTVRSDLPPDWFDAFRPRLHSGGTSVVPGARLRRMETNWDTHGVVRVVADSFGRAEADCDRIRAEIEELLGIELIALAPTRDGA